MTGLLISKWETLCGGAAADWTQQWLTFITFSVFDSGLSRVNVWPFCQIPAVLQPAKRCSRTSSSFPVTWSSPPTHTTVPVPLIGLLHVPFSATSSLPNRFSVWLFCGRRLFFLPFKFFTNDPELTSLHHMHHMCHIYMWILTCLYSKCTVCGIHWFFYLLVSPISYSLSLSNSNISTSSLPVVERLLLLLMLSLASVMAKRSPLLHSIGSSRMAAEGEERGRGGYRKTEEISNYSQQTVVNAVFLRWITARMTRTAIQSDNLQNRIMYLIQVFFYLQ